MTLPLSKKAKRSLLILLGAGAAAGFLNGLLGAGGGVVLVYLFGHLNPDKSPAGVRDNFAATIACVLPITLLSMSLYASGGRMDVRAISPLVLPAILGGALGAYLLDKINTTLLKKLFALLVIYSGFSMIFR